MNAEENRGIALAMVAASSPRLPDAGQLREAAGLTALKPGLIGKLFGKKAADETPVAWDGTNFVIPYKDGMVTVALMPAPIPWSDLEGPCATSMFWDGATEAMRKHSHHFLVVIMGVEQDPVLQRLLLTRVVSAVASLCDAAGIYWGEGTLVHEPGMFIEAAKAAKPSVVPVPLWVDFRIEQNEDGSLRTFTTGMEPLGFKEIEIRSIRVDPQELYEFIANTAGYIVQFRNPIPDGDTMGRTAQEKFKVSYGPSMFEREGDVMILTPVT